MLVQESRSSSTTVPRLSLRSAAEFHRRPSVCAAISGWRNAGFFRADIGNFRSRTRPRRSCSTPAPHAGPRRHAHHRVDLVKDAKILNAAYDDGGRRDPRSSTSNLLRRIKPELGADFDLDAFSHQAFYNSERRRVECISPAASASSRVCGRVIAFSRVRDRTQNAFAVLW